MFQKQRQQGRNTERPKTLNAAIYAKKFAEEITSEVKVVLKQKWRTTFSGLKRLVKYRIDVL